MGPTLYLNFCFPVEGEDLVSAIINKHSRVGGRVGFREVFVYEHVLDVINQATLILGQRCLCQQAVI